MAERPLVVVTPWYPSEAGPYDGIFVREAVAALRRPADEVLVVHLHNVPSEQVVPPLRTRTDLAEVLRITVPVEPLTPRDEMARAQRRALAEAMPPELEQAEVVHVHVGMPSGWAVAGLLPASTRLVVTEHATYLPRVLRTPVGLEMYRELLDRSAALLTVGEREARSLRRIYPQMAEKIGVAGNPVSEERFALRATAPEQLDRWLYVGNFIPRKGVDRVIRALAAWVEAHPQRPTELSLVGGGLQREELAALADELGVADRVHFLGSADPDELPAIFAEHDVLLHLSSHETFGLTVVEAVMSGLPVLVTACGGPEETLSDAAAAGMVRFVSLNPDPETVIAGLTALEASAPTADRGSARRVLVERFGDRHFAERLDRVLAGQALSLPPADDAFTVLGLALSPRASRRIVQVHQEVLRQGGRAVLVTNQPGDALATDRRVEVLDLAEHDAHTPLHALENVLLTVIPRTLLRALRKACHLAARLPGPQRRAASRGENLVSTLLAKHRKVAGAIRARYVHRYVYSFIDPWRLARYTVVRRRAELDAMRPDAIIMGDDDALPLAWRLARLYPDAQVMSTPSEATVRQLVAGGTV